MKSYTVNQADQMARFIKHMFKMFQKQDMVTPLDFFTEGTEPDFEVFKEVERFTFEIEDWV